MFKQGEVAERIDDESFAKVAIEGVHAIAVD